MNIEQARFNMIEQQIRTWEVLDQDVLDLLYVVRREEFVPEAYRELAFSDLEIPIGEGERMMAPKFEARVLQELGVKPRRSRYSPTWKLRAPWWQISTVSVAASSSPARAGMAFIGRWTDSGMRHTSSSQGSRTSTSTGRGRDGSSSQALSC